MSSGQVFSVETALGDFEIATAPEKAPCTAAYFGKLFDLGMFDGASVFRIVTPANGEMRTDAPISVVQLGLFEMETLPETRFVHEGTNITGLCHKKWTISAARGGLGENYPSFFICMRDEPALDFGGKRHPDGHGFAAFGKVKRGFNVLEQVFTKSESGEFLEQPIAIEAVRPVE